MGQIEKDLWKWVLNPLLNEVFPWRAIFKTTGRLQLKESINKNIIKTTLPSGHLLDKISWKKWPKAVKRSLENKQSIGNQKWTFLAWNAKIYWGKSNPNHSTKKIFGFSIRPIKSPLCFFFNCELYQISG